MAEHIIELKGVTKYFGENLIIDNVSFYVNKGEFITFLGPSGCGKTTVDRMPKDEKKIIKDDMGETVDFEEVD